MGEIVIACFIGIWLVLAGVFAFRRLEKDYKEMESKK